MIKSSYSSGDVIADRRAEYARGLAESGDHIAAAEVMEQALEIVPDWAAGWDLLGSYRESASDIGGAISAWRHLEALDDEGVFGAALKLAAHGAAAAGEGTATSYVEALFDQYAPQFEAALVDRLGYTVPARLEALIAEVMAERGIARFGRGIDLGCGTGLMGARLRGRVDYLEGIDLSAGMVAAAAGKSIYDRVEKAELVEHLTARTDAADIITAADVFIYCGALPPVLAACHRAMAPGALLAFSLESHDGTEPHFLRPSLRYAHGMEPSLVALAAAGFEVVRFARADLRQDRGAPIEGMLVVAAKPA